MRIIWKKKRRNTGTRKKTTLRNQVTIKVQNIKKN